MNPSISILYFKVVDMTFRAVNRRRSGLLKEVRPVNKTSRYLDDNLFYVLLRLPMNGKFEANVKRITIGRDFGDSGDLTLQVCSSSLES